MSALPASPINAVAIAKYLALRASCDKSMLLITKKGEVRLKNRADLGCWTLFKASLGFGKGSFKNIARTFNAQEIPPDDYETVSKFNGLIYQYNTKHSLGKQSKFLNNVKSSVAEARSRQLIDLLVADPEERQKDYDQSIEQAYDACYNLFSSKMIESSFDEFIFAIQILSAKLETLDKKNDKELVDKILNLKNFVRAHYLPVKDGREDLPLKTATFHQTNLSKSNQALLSSALKNLRLQVLGKYFSKRLAKNRRELDLLKNTLEKGGFDEKTTKFLTAQLERWEKKLNQGKPISIPKWYHCTKSLEAQRSILTTEIIYDSSFYPGAFVANKPVNSVLYGEFGISLGSYIEKTGVNDPNDEVLYPTYSLWDDTDDAVAYDAYEVENDNKSKPSELWLGFQRGKNVFHDLSFNQKSNKSHPGRLGIPLYLKNKISESLNYYKDTSVSFIFKRNGAAHVQEDMRETQKLSKELRIQVLNESEVTALRTLVDRTFVLTLPPAWKWGLTPAETL